MPGNKPGHKPGQTRLIQTDKLLPFTDNRSYIDGRVSMELNSQLSVTVANIYYDFKI